MQRIYVEVIATTEAERKYLKALASNKRFIDAFEWVAVDRNHVRAMLRADGLGLLIGYTLLKKFEHAARIYAIKGDVIYPRDLTGEFLEFAERITTSKGMKPRTKKEELEELEKFKEKPLESLLNRRVI